MLALLASGCMDTAADASAGYLVIEADARKAGARLRVDGREITDVLPERIALGAEVTVEMEGLGEVPVEVGPGEIVVLRGHDARAEPFTIGPEASEDRLWIRGSDTAVRALAERVSAEVSARGDGAFELYAPALLSVLGDYDAGEAIDATLPIVANETLGNIVGLPVSASIADQSMALGSERGSEDALGVGAALMGDAAGEGAGGTLSGEPAIAAARLDDAPIALVSSSGASIALHTFTDGSVTVGGERYARHQAYARPICRYPVLRVAQ